MCSRLINRALRNAQMGDCRIVERPANSIPRLTMKILIIAPDIPFPPIGGAQVRTYHLIQSLADRHELTMIGFIGDRGPSAPEGRVRVVEVPWDWPEAYQAMKSSDADASSRALEELTSPNGEPWFVSCYQLPTMEDAIQKIGREGFDAVLIEHSAMARFLPCLPPDVPKILDFVDVHSLIARRAALEKPRDVACGEIGEADRISRFERHVASQCAACLVVSQHEADAARALLGVQRVHIVPNGVDTRWFAPGENVTTPGQLLFTGQMSYAPNVEAVGYFVREILPKIRSEIPETCLHIVGNKPVREVQALAGSNVVVHGFVPDTRPFHRQAEVVVVPLLHGGGTRLKILEAAASGKAIVTTSFGVEGLALEHGQDLIVADSPDDFARAVVAILRDPSLRNRLGQRAREASPAYDWHTIQTEFRTIMESLAEEAPRDGSQH